MNIFDQFTRKYSLAKTLRFELKPVWNTGQMLETESVFKTDRIRREKYEAIKPWIDRLHREFIKDALSKFRFSNFEPYKKTFEAWQKDKKSKPAKNELANEENKLREEIVEQFNVTAKEWAEEYPDLKLKKIDMSVLFEAGIFRVLRERYKDESGTTIQINDGKSANIFGDWNKWTGYFKKFFQTRKNFYSSKDESTAVAYRIVNQNLRRFIQNIQLFEEAKSKIDTTKIEKDLKISCAAVFSLKNYNTCLLQNGIDAYNRILGGYVGDHDEKIPGINQAINEYRQKNKDDKISFLAILDKQIHSEKDKFLDAIESDEELIKRLVFFTNAADEKIGIFKKLIDDFASNNTGYDLNKIYVSSDAFERNAGRWFTNYAVFEQMLLDTAKKHKDAYKIVDQKPPHEKDGEVKYPDFLICAHIKTALDKISESVFKERYYEGIHGFESLPRFDQFLQIIKHEIKQQFSQYELYRDELKQTLISAKPKIDGDIKISIKNFADSALAIYQMAKYFAVEKKRRWLDYFKLDDHFYNAADTGYMLFYGDVGKLKSAYEEIVKEYNAVRNYLTKKPYSTDKWVLNFDIQTLADGWDKNKEKENGAVIFRKDGRYYLGIMHCDHLDLFTDKNQREFAGSGYEKMVYKYFPNPSQMIPKCSTQLSIVKKHFDKSEEGYCLKNDEFIAPLCISKEIFNLNNLEYQKSYLETLQGASPDESLQVKADSKKQSQIKLFQKEFLGLSKNERVYKSALKKWIDFCKEFLKSYESTATSDFDYSHIKPTDQYDSIDKFYRDVEKGSYKVSFLPISEQYLKKKNEKGELFIFEIHNKDWNLKDGKKKEGTKNLHTLFWEQLFSDENKARNFIFKLNGEAELFFRPKTEGKKLGYKIRHNGKWMRIIKEDEKYFYIKDANDAEKELAKVDRKGVVAVSDRKRYLEDAILFHCPITINRVSENKTDKQVNADIREMIVGNKDLRIIGIDRGEKNLAYYSVIDQRGKIIEDGSLNTVGEADGKSTPYAEILNKRAKEREAARREWQEVEQIKDTKKGYVSQVVRKLADLAIKHNAIIVLEDLSMRFKQIRGGIEKSIYQQFEKQLIDKLSFLVNKKETDSTKPGHPLKAYQLASPIAAFKDMGKQTGIIFYTEAGYTSRTCPVCGFRRNIRLQFESVDKAEEKLKAFDAFVYDSTEDVFRVSYSRKKFLSAEQLKSSKAKNKLYENKEAQDSFTLTTKDAIRYKWFQRGSPRLRAMEKIEGVSDGEAEEQETKRGKTKKFDVTLFIKGVFKEEGISLIGGDLKNTVIEKRSGKLYDKLFFAFYLLIEIRHSISGIKIDYIHCPQCLFDSQAKFQGREFNSDANGAYNIARKGIIILEKMRQFARGGDIKNMGWENMTISIDEWDKFVQKKSSFLFND